MYTLLPRFMPLPLVCAVSAALLSACGGSFNNPSHITQGHSQVVLPATPAPTPPAPPAPTITDPLLAPTLGSAMPIVKRNLYYDIATNAYAEEHKALNVLDLSTMGSQTLDAFVADLQKRYKGQPIKQSTDKGNPYQFVKAGWIFTSLYQRDQELVKDNGKLTGEYAKGAGYLYYYGDKPTTGRLHGKASYEGHWDFITDAKRKRDLSSDGAWRGGGSSYTMDERFGDELSASSFAEQVFGQYAPRTGNHKAVFSADFDAKTLTGTLSTKQQKTKTETPTYLDRYDITATITGNRFVGSAVAKNADATFNLFSKNATGRLEGGFFGDNAEELAGKFLSDDNSLFAVFAGKTDNQVALEQQYDGKFVEVTQDTDLNPAQKAQVLNFANLANVNLLYINGQRIELLPPTANKTTTQSVDLASGQKAVITSFGATDGSLRLGSITKTAKVKAKPSDDEINEAKEKLIALADSQESKVDTLLTELTETEDEDEQKRLSAQILKEALAGYSDGQAKTNAQTSVERSLKQLIANPENYNAFDRIVNLVKKGDKYDTKLEANWQAFLPNQEPKDALLTADTSLHGLYLLGERTKTSDLPKAGEITYQGTWHGRIGQYYQSEAGYGEFDGKSSFSVDFGKKRLSGSLTEKSGVEPAFIISAVIDNNGFVGTATSRAGGINLDKGQQQNQQILPQTLSHNLTGGFYGDQAKHLAGSFSFENQLEGSDSTVVGGAVFYGTKEGE